VPQVIIAGAGGAAHLPGMVAALTPLPVVGVPVVPPTGAALSGVDALLSIVQARRPTPASSLQYSHVIWTLGWGSAWFRGCPRAFHAFVTRAGSTRLTQPTGTHEQLGRSWACALTRPAARHQMPRGVPVATVAVGNAANAGLLAARILATSDAELQGRVLEQQARMEAEVLAKAARLEADGWRAY